MKKRVYLVCDKYNEKAAQISGCPNVDIEHLGLCSGRIIAENGFLLGSHTSATFDWLRHDLKAKIKNIDDYEVVDLIGKEVPELFKME